MFACADFIKASKQCLWCIRQQLAVHTLAALQCLLNSFLQNALWSFHVEMCCSKQCSTMQVLFMVPCVQWTNKQKIEAPTNPVWRASKLMPGPWKQLDSPSACTSVSAEPRKEEKLNVFFSGAESSWHSIEGRAGRFKEDIGLHQFEANLMIRFHHLEGLVNAHFDLI